VAGTLSGPARRATVLAAFPTCLYVGLDRHEDVLAVLTRDAVDLPIGVRLAVSADELARDGGWGAHPGDDVVVGAGRVALPFADVLVARTRAAATHRLPVDRAPTHPRPGASSPSTGRQFPVDRAPRSGTPLLAASIEVARQAVRGHEVRSCVDRLVGAGQGLTPSGDDALCGILLTLRSVDLLDAHAAVAGAVRARLGATTSISAALLSVAADGWAAPPVIRMLTRLGDATSPANAVATTAALDPRDHDVRAVLAIGHSSGADLLTGVTATLDAVTAFGRVHPHNPQGAPRG
jgi:hypothetical protein